MNKKYMPKLTNKDREEIFLRYTTTEISMPELSKEFNVSTTTIFKTIKKLEGNKKED